MSKIFTFIIAVLILASCNNKKKTSAGGEKNDTIVTNPVITGTTQKVIYKSATYYTGRVDFYFTDDKGAEVVVGISNFPGDSAAIYPAYLLESTDSVEGPPGENPAMVGKEFLLIKNIKGEVREIKPATQ